MADIEITVDRIGRKWLANGGEVVRLDGGYSSGIIAQSKMQVYFASLDDIYSFAK